MQLDPGAPGMTQPEGITLIGDDQVKGAIGCGIEMRESLGGSGRIGMVERLEHQLAARTLTGRRAQRAVPVEYGGGDAPIVDPEPRPAGEPVEPRHDLRPVRPMTTRRLPWPIDHLVAIGADQHRPAVARPAQDHQSAHSVARIAAHNRSNIRDATGASLRWLE